jgi:hypothetical protein
MIPAIDPVAAVAQHASRRATDNVFTAGPRLTANGVVGGADTAALAAEASRGSAELMKRAGTSVGWLPSAG